MTITDGYTTQAVMKDRFDIDHTDDDDLIDLAVTSASRDIDAYCQRRFHKDGSASARIFYGSTRTSGLSYVLVDDFHTISGLVVKTDSSDDGTFDTTWSSDEYELHPLNGLSGGVEGWPYERFHAVKTRTFPDGGKRARVQITADWGWDAVPAQVGDACQIWAGRLLRRKDSPDGIAGGFDFEPIRVSSRLDPDVMQQLAAFKKPVVARAR